MNDIAIGTTSVAAIYSRDLLKYTIFIPSLEEQKNIAKILSDIDKDIDTVEKRIAKARNIKEGMMQELLTGAIRLI